MACLYLGCCLLRSAMSVRTRSAWQTGWYREEPLALLEEETTAPQGTGSNRELHLDVDLKVVLETLKKEQKEAGKRQQKEIAERILERVYLLERRVKETAPSQSHVTVQVAAPQTSASAHGGKQEYGTDGPCAAADGKRGHTKSGPTGGAGSFVVGFYRSAEGADPS